MSNRHRPASPRPGPPGPSSADGEPLRLRLRDPGELVAAVPHLLGFRPVASLVLVAVHDDGGRTPRPAARRLGVVARADLPEPDDVAAVVGACATRMVPTGPVEVTAVVVAEGPDDADTPPRVDVADAVGSAFAAHRIAVPTRLWVPRIASGVPWRCYPPCDCRGRVAATDDSPLAAASAWLGQVTYASRAALEASLAPDPPRPRLAGLVDAEREAAVLDRELGGPAAARRDLAAVAAARDEVAAGRPLGDGELARLAVALADPRVRDVVMGWALADEGVSAAAEQLWTLLVRALPAPEVAEPAVLLACAQLVRGGSALVGVALERARRADPGHRLTGLIETLLASGAGPDALRTVIREASTESAARLRVG
ncbi:DUF4192 domain-containing protein [Actinomycetospora lemnae]|uniref:DUF4192 domain-containing protein n=1 Tax=Actinomycetospora lemnae TaxID=3019891 RepID=A0ABT5SQ44_9PSEU|nr:DUF4192 domain-containing protein [Actinomycetospora sp. DW7H6]MDD7964157.1 DUF4192 domain-containing protein [Actinomycetospora sp. DW7H6]